MAAFDCEDPTDEVNGRLLKAVLKNDLDEVEDLLEDPWVDVNTAVSKDGSLPIHLAARRVNGIEVLDALVRRGAPLESLSAGKNRATAVTPMLVALRAGRVEHVEYLLDKGVGVNKIVDLKKRTPLHVVVTELCTPALFRVLFDRGADANAFDRDGWTPVHCAAALLDYRPEVMRQLLGRGAGDPKLQSRNDLRYNAMHVAVTKENVLAIEDLATVHKFDLEAGDNLGRTALQLAVDAYTLCSREKKSNRSALEKKRKVIKVLSRVGADANVSFQYARSPFSDAARKAAATSLLARVVDGFSKHRDLEVVRTLLEVGRADPNTRDGYSPLALAVVNYHMHLNLRPQYLELIRVLLKAGADTETSVCAGDGIKIPLLYLVASKENVEPLALLVEEGGADPNATLDLSFVSDGSGGSRFFRGLSRLLWSSSSNEKHGYSLLHIALAANNTKIVEYLVRHPKFDLEAAGAHGASPLDLAIAAGNSKAAKLIRRKLKDRNNNTRK